MKRSEMIEIMGNWLRHQYPGCNFNSVLLFKEDADKLLTFMEKKNFLPPGYMKPIPFESNGKQYPLIPGDFPNEQGVWCTPGIQEWEPESIELTGDSAKNHKAAISSFFKKGQSDND